MAIKVGDWVRFKIRGGGGQVERINRRGGSLSVVDALGYKTKVMPYDVERLAHVGRQVRFTIDHLGASHRDELHCVTGETFGKGDEGVLAFPHPNLGGWWYVEVESRKEPGTKLYVGVGDSMFEEV